MKKSLSLLFVLMFFSSCATIFTGDKRTVLFESDPPGAKLFVNGMEKGKTPVSAKVRADDRVDFRLDGYQERVVVMDSKFNIVAILNGFSLLGWGIDAVTGSLKRVDTPYVKVTLETDKSTSAVRNYLDNGRIDEVRFNTESKIIETRIILNN